MSGSRGRWTILALSGLLALGAAACSPSPSPHPAAPTTSSAPATESPRPIATDTRELRFSAAGDFDSTAQTRKVLSAIGARRDDLTLALGDLSYGRSGEEARWCRLVTDRVTAAYPFELLAGNHESNGRNGDIRAFARCLPNRLPGLVGDYPRQWYADLPAKDPLVRFVMIAPAIEFPDGVASYAAGTAEYDWTRNALRDARAKGIPWTVVGMHTPCLSVGEYSCEPGRDLVDLLVSERVPLVLSGHEHGYQRTAQITSSTRCPRLVLDAFEPACVADRDADLALGAGTTFVTVGTGGRALREVHRKDPEFRYFVVTSGSDETPTWGSLAVTVRPDRLVASFEPAQGHLRDAFVIDRSAPAQ